MTKKASKKLAPNSSGDLAAQPEFDILTTSLHSALRKGTTLSAAPPELQSKTVARLKTPQRVYAISPTAKAVDRISEGQTW